MDKYVLVPQDRFDNMLKKEKNQLKASANSDNLQKAPPPGLPPTDERSKEGFTITDQEAEDINRAIIDASLQRSSEQKSDSIERPNTTSGGDWRQYWEAVVD